MVINEFIFNHVYQIRPQNTNSWQPYHIILYANWHFSARRVTVSRNSKTYDKFHFHWDIIAKYFAASEIVNMWILNVLQRQAMPDIQHMYKHHSEITLTADALAPIGVSGCHTDCRGRVISTLIGLSFVFFPDQAMRLQSAALNQPCTCWGSNIFRWPHPHPQRRSSSGFIYV